MGDRTRWPRLRDRSLAVLLAMALSSTAPIHGQRCPDEAAPAVGIGVGLVQCPGGICVRQRAANDPLAPHAARVWWEFSVEPRLWEIERPSADGLQEGDTLVAVEGLPITTLAAGRRLGDLSSGETLELLVRRGDGRERVVPVLAALSCRPTRLYVGASARAPADAGMGDRPMVTGQGLGLTLGCDRCRWKVRADGRLALTTETFPSVIAVALGSPAERAGIQPGDRLTAIDGLDLRTDEGSARLAEIGSGDALRVRLLRPSTGGAEETAFPSKDPHRRAQELDLVILLP